MPDVQKDHEFRVTLRVAVLPPTGRKTKPKIVVRSARCSTLRAPAPAYREARPQRHSRQLSITTADRAQIRGLADLRFD